MHEFNFDKHLSTGLRLQKNTQKFQHTRLAVAFACIEYGECLFKADYNIRIKFCIENITQRIHSR